MAIYDFGKMSVESLIQTGLDTFLKRQKQTAATEDNGKFQLIKRSLDRKGELYELKPSHTATLGAYQLRHQEGKGSILVTLEHLRKLYQTLNREILEHAANGNLKKAENSWQQQKNINLNQYTHRIKVFRVNKAKLLFWMIDMDLHKELTDENSYGSGTAKSMIVSLLTTFLDEPQAKASEDDYLDALIEQDWVLHIQKVATPFYNHSQLTHKVLFRKPPRYAF
jgi:hypothetical protein